MTSTAMGVNELWSERERDVSYNASAQPASVAHTCEAAWRVWGSHCLQKNATRSKARNVTVPRAVSPGALWTSPGAGWRPRQASEYPAPHPQERSRDGHRWRNV